MDNPTHADAFLNLLSSCFPSGCRSNPPALPPSPQLGALLRDPESDDAMSLHSTYRPHTRPRKKKTMELCGLHLFGKPRGHIRLEDDEHEPIPARPRYDSDAAPLPDSTIQSLSTPTTEQPTRHESPEEELARLRADKAARKARRRERKLKRQLALESGEFEGFIGSGTFPISPPSTTTSTPGIEDLMSDRGSALLDVDPEDGDADMGAAVYTRSTRSRSESGSSATRSSRAREEIRGNALGLVQESIPEVKEPEPEPEPVPSPKPKPKPTLARPKPKIRITDLPLSSPGAGPGPRTLENSPRLAVLDTPKQSEYFQSANLDSPRLSIPRPIGFPSTGLTRPSGHVGKSVSSSAAPGLNSTSPRALGPNQGESVILGSGSVIGGSGSFVASSTGSESALAGGDRNESVLDQAGRSRDAGSQRSSRDSDGSRSVGHGEGSGAGWKGRVTPQMGVALANRGGE